MSRRQARFEIVRTAAGWHARFRANNGQIVWTTEVYTRRRAAVAAIRVLSGGCEINWTEGWIKLGLTTANVREVDER